MAVMACGEDAQTSSSGSGGGAAGGSGGSGGGEVCGLMAGVPSGACDPGDECSFADGGCTFDSYCLDGAWALVRSCNGADCPREGLTVGEMCTVENAECLYEEEDACVATLACTGGTWTDSGC